MFKGFVIILFLINNEALTKKSIGDTYFLGSIPIFSDITCGLITTINMKEEYYGTCFGAITPFSSTFLTLPLHIYIGTSLEKYTLTFVPKLLTSLLIWGYSIGIVFATGWWVEPEKEERRWREYQMVLIIGNTVLAGINVYELVDAIKKVNKYNLDIKKETFLPYFFTISFLSHERTPFLQFGIRF
jgi:hypothetical protein